MTDDAQPPALEVTRLDFRWPGGAVPVLGVDALTLMAGESLFLHGPSGCGKSTLLSAIAGAVEIPSGAVSVVGQDVGALSGGARDRFRGDHLGVIFQVFNLVPWLSALDNVLLPCRFSARRAERAGPDPAETARRLLAELGLGDPAIAAASAQSLSVGQQQRVAAARALIGRPELILADEPTSALDDDAKVAFVDLLARECAATGSALLFVSHDRSLEGHFDRALGFADLNRPVAPA
jgi:putative ABC transport system ATP-binding protein